MATKLFLVRTDDPKNSYVKATDPPIGLLSLSAMVKRELPDVVDVRLEDLRLHGRSEVLFENELLEWRPDVIGLSVMSAEAYRAVYWVHFIRERLPETKIIIGGPYSSAAACESLEKTSADVAFIGEAELSLVAWLRCFMQGTDARDIPGIVLRDESGTAYITKSAEVFVDVNTLPIPDWDAISLKDYWHTGNSMNIFNADPHYASIISSRGCPFNCSYCHHIYGKKVRFRDLDLLIEEILILYHKHNVRELQIVDDIFNIKPERVKEFCRRIKNSGIKLYFSFPNGLRADLLTEEVIDDLRDVGAYSLTFAIESASERIQKLIRKNLNLNKAEKMIRYAYDKGFIPRAFFMLGFVTETEEEVNRTIDFAVGLPVLQGSFFSVVPYKNTHLFELTKQHCPDFKAQDGAYYHGYRPKYLPYDLPKLQRNAYLRFYFTSFRLCVFFWRIPRKLDFIKQMFKNGMLIILLRFIESHLQPKS